MLIFQFSSSNLLIFYFNYSVNYIGMPFCIDFNYDKINHKD